MSKCDKTIVQGRVIKYSIIDLLTGISRCDLIRIVKATKKFVNKYFAPIWGTGATFQIFPRGYIPSTEETIGTVSTYFADQFAIPVGFGGAHYQVINGITNQPQVLMPQVPLVPEGKLVIVIPLNNNVGPTLDDTINNLGITLSHEVIETSGNPFNALGNVPYDNAKFNLPYDNSTRFDAFVQEIADPVEDGDFNQTFKVCGITMTNFVTPEFFNPFAPPGTRFDFLGNVQKPFTPYGGLIPLYTITCHDPPAHAIDISFTDDPSVVFRIPQRLNINCTTSVCQADESNETELVEKLRKLKQSKYRFISAKKAKLFEQFGL